MQQKQEVKKNPNRTASSVVSPRQTAINRILMISVFLAIGEKFEIPMTRAIVFLATLAVLSMFIKQKHQLPIDFRKAAQEGDLDRVRALLQILGIEYLNQKSGNGKSALHWAARYKQDHVVKYLLSQGADINLQDNEGNTAIHEAINFERKSKTFSTLALMVAARPDGFYGMFTEPQFNPKLDPRVANNKGETVFDLLLKMEKDNEHIADFKKALKCVAMAYQLKVGHIVESVAPSIGNVANN